MSIFTTPRQFTATLRLRIPPFRAHHRRLLSVKNKSQHPLEGSVKTEEDENMITSRAIWGWGIVGIALGGTLAWFMVYQKQAGEISQVSSQPAIPDNRFEDKNNKVLKRKSATS